MNSARLRFGVLGPLLIEADGGPVTPPRSPIMRGLLGALLLAGERALPADRLVELVWPERADEVTRGSVQVGISRLRQWLKQVDPTPEPEWTLDHDGSGYRLALQADAVDLSRFRALVESADATEDNAARAGLLESALALWRGPVLSDLTILDTSDPLPRSVTEEVHTAALELTAAAAASGRAGAALDLLAGLVAAHPLEERLQAAMIELLAADGRTADALRRYQAYRESVVEELGVDPGERVQAAYLAALAQDDRSPAAGPIAEPPVPAQLPPRVADFTGRDDQMTALIGLLTAREVPPVVVVNGMGGVGKTTLALQAAHRLAGQFPDGQLYARLRRPDGGAVDVAEVAGDFLRAFGLGGQDVPPSLEGRSAQLRTVLSGRRVLILLDDAATEGDVRPLLPGAPGCAVIVTSRVLLAGLEGADRVDLAVFDTEQAVGLLGQIIGADRVDAEPEAAAEVARLCGHIPLAVRIAGTRLAGRRHRTLAWLADTLGDAQYRLDELTAGDLAVRASFRLGYTRLPDETRRLFRLLGLLETPDFAEWAAAALLGGSYRAAQAHLEALVDAQLLVVTGVDANGWTRHRYHDLVRIYAREVAFEEEPEEDRRAAVRRALGAWLRLAERAAEHVPGPCYASIHGPARRYDLPAEVTERLLADPMAWFDAERAAMAAAVEQACTFGFDDLAWDLAASMEKYIDIRSLTLEWVPLHEKAMALCAAAGNRLGEAVLLRGLMDMRTWVSAESSGDAMGASYDAATRSLQLFEEVGERRGVADALVAQCWGLIARGESEQALATARRALRLAGETDHLGGEARAHQMMGVAYGEQQPDRAAVHLARCLELARLHGNPRFEATAMQFLGAAQCLSGQIESGHDLLVGSLRICQRLKDHYAETFSLLYLSKLYAALGDERALPTVNTALYLSRRHGFQHHLADALKVLGELDLAAGRFDAATANLEESVRLWRARGWHAFLAETLRVLGRAYQEAGDEASAKKVWSEAVSLYEQLGDTAAAADLSAQLGER